MQPDLVWTLVFLSQRWSTLVNVGQRWSNVSQQDIQVNTEEIRAYQRSHRSTDVNSQQKSTEVRERPSQRSSTVSSNKHGRLKEEERQVSTRINKSRAREVKAVT